MAGTRKQPDINAYEGFIFDLDGTIYRGENLIEGADTAVKAIRQSGKKIVFVSNKTTGSIADYTSFLNHRNVPCKESEIINATEVIKEYLAEEHRGKAFYAIGEEIFIHEIINAGLHFSKNPREVDVLLITLDRNCTFQKMETAVKCLEHNSRFYAANIDDSCPVEDGEIWDAGTTIAALEKRSHRKLEKHFGKPSQYMIERVMKYMELPREKLCIVGDRLETDILMGNSAGIDTVLVNSGVRNYTNGSAIATPTFTLNSIKELNNYLTG